MSGDRPKLRVELDDVGIHADSNQEELSLKQLSEAYAQVLQGLGAADKSSSKGHNREQQPDVIDIGNIADESNANETTSSIKPRSLKEIEGIDNAGCPISPKSIVEAVLFVGAPAGIRLTEKKLAGLMRDVSPQEVKKTVGELNNEYEQRNSAFRIVEESGNYKMQLSPDLIAVQNHFFGRDRSTTLSQGAIDVLAIVAYNQPVSRSQVDAIRARPSAGVLNQLIRRNLIVANESGSSQEKLFQTSERFLQLFGLGSLDDLPQTSVVSDLEELTDI